MFARIPCRFNVPSPHFLVMYPSPHLLYLRQQERDVPSPHFLGVNPTPHLLPYLRQQERDGCQDPQPVQSALRLLGAGGRNLRRYNNGTLGSTITVLKAATCGGTIMMS